MARSSDDMPTGAEHVAGSANPTALSVAQLGRLLGLAEAKVGGHLADGAPAGADGTVNLVYYVAWLNVRLKEHYGD